MRVFDTLHDDPADIRAAITERISEEDNAETEAAVREVLERVQNEGDDAVIDYIRRYDAPLMTISQLEVGRAELEQSRRTVSIELIEALDQAARNIQEFHQREAGQLQSWMHLAQDGRFLGQMLRPVKRVGIYVPGGQAAYPSTVLMAAIPAAVAGVEEVILCTPPGRNGQIPPLVAAACQGWADRVFRIGGPAAIAAMAFGTGSVPRVDVIVGPGSRMVNAAKRQAYGLVGLDMLAGPSEICIIADGGANPRFVAADLLAQIEHDADNRGVVLTDSAQMSGRILEEAESMFDQLMRKDILRQTLSKVVLVTTTSIAEAADLANTMAPEHLELQVRDPLSVLPLIQNAGAVLLGDSTGAALGDYVAGPSHTLPTNGTARFSSPLSVASFIKRTSVVSYTPVGARLAATTARILADGEGFDGHVQSALIRLEGAAS
jgi:histidinol dehydrogenase